jgi:hypothetical protein
MRIIVRPIFARDNHNFSRIEQFSRIRLHYRAFIQRSEFATHAHARHASMRCSWCNITRLQLQSDPQITGTKIRGLPSK